jgi:hypothetical protein
MGSERQPGVMRAQKRDLLIKNFTFSVQSILLGVFIGNWKSFFQLFSNLKRKHVIGFMNIKSSCGYVRYFLPLKVYFYENSIKF